MINYNNIWNNKKKIIIVILKVINRLGKFIETIKINMQCIVIASLIDILNSYFNV